MHLFFFRKFVAVVVFVFVVVVISDRPGRTDVVVGTQSTLPLSNRFIGDEKVRCVVVVLVVTATAAVVVVVVVVVDFCCQRVLNFRARKL